jgi:hypothetical protein
VLSEKSANTNLIVFGFKCTATPDEEFEDIKGVIRIRESKENKSVSR